MTAPSFPLHGTVEPLGWESQFFGLHSAIVRLSDSGPAITEADLNAWERVQVKIPASDAARLDALQQRGFQLVEGEVDLALNLCATVADPQAQVAGAEDIPRLRELAAQAFAQSRFRAPWYPPEASGRFYAQWIENAVKGEFDHQCLVFRAADGDIRAFVSLRQLNDHEARIGLLAGRGAGEALMQAASYWTQTRQLTRLRVATQAGNTAALKRYIQSGANVESTAYWLYR
ncbi:dTDP-4-amino-4,6-dideoxy-D-galactose acyltransferase [Enterobacter sp. SA187]|uniref:dTDP-4-amino-4,6-dideoxy-D-galactose acyltransferase n=1 Tax=Enterobacter sp. SA187 TaxID=1914861 RepID=UPI0009338E43|nr:dTDP-4-amino-4,6-dideoxy-D-galactose acyltransferase [Enterobacter sp. SA187]